VLFTPPNSNPLPCTHTSTQCSTGVGRERFRVSAGHPSAL
jgi:hypothetical protein